MDQEKSNKKTYCVHLFNNSGKYYMFDYNNLLPFEVDEETYILIQKLIQFDNKNITVHNLQTFNEINDSLQYLFDEGLLKYKPGYRYSEDINDTAFISYPTVHNCNLRCKYCFANSGDNFKGDICELNEMLLPSILNFFISEFGYCTRYRIDFVSGGEPLLNFDIIKKTKDLCIQMMLPDKKYMIWLVTNGIFLSEDYIDYFNQNDIKFGLSLDGDEYIHDLNRKDINGNGTYRQVLQKYENIISNKKLSRQTRSVWILSVISSLTPSLVDIIKHHRSIGVNRLQMKIVRLSQNNELSLNTNTYEHFKCLYDDLIRYFITQFRESNSIDEIIMILNENDFLGGMLITLILRTPNVTRCLAGRNKISVTANGDIYPCDSFVGIDSYIIGSISEGFYSKRDDFFKTSVYDNIVCNHCWAKHICGGGCYYENYLYNNDIFTPNLQKCKLYKHVLESAINLLALLETDKKTSERLTISAKLMKRMEW